MLAARVLAIVHAWSAWRALQRCRPHRQQRSSSPACSLLRQAAAERVFSAQPVVQEAEAAGKDLEDEAYGGLLLKATLSEEVNGLGATAAAARLSSRAGRPKPRGDMMLKMV